MYTWWLTYFASAEKSVRDRASSALASHAAPVVAVGEPSYEHRHAIMEAWRNTAATAYFDHLPHNDTEAGRRSFDFAYSAAWQRKGIIDAAAPPTVVSLDLPTLFELGKVYANVCASPHHMTFSVESLRSLIESLGLPPGRGMVPMTEGEAVECVAQVLPVISSGNEELWHIQHKHAVKIVRCVEAHHGIKEGS